MPADPRGAARPLGPERLASIAGRSDGLAEELEETARLWLMCDPKPAALSAAALDELRDTFGAQW
jgi:hypothetical protein